MKLVMMLRGKWRILDFGSGLVGRSRSVRREERNQLQDLTVRATLRHTILSGNRFVKSGGDVKKPCVAQLKRSSHVDLSNATCGKG